MKGRFMHHARNVKKGFASVLMIDPGRDYIHPTGGGFKNDARRLRGDVVRVGGDMKGVVARRENGKQTDSR
jgi:hypothetical protein